MTENVVKVNKLPAMTWNWLRMNNDLFDADGLKRAGNTDAALPEDMTAVEIEQDELSELISLETGMGDEMAKISDRLYSDGENVLPYDSLIVADKGEKASSPVRLNNSLSVEKGMSRCFMVAREGSELFVISDMTGLSEADRKAGTETRILVKDNARVKLVEVYNGSAEGEFFTSIGADLGDDAHLELVQVFLGGKKLNVGCHVMLKGDRAGFTEYTAYDVPGGSNYDFNYVARHLGKETEADIHASGVLHGRSEKTMRQTIDFCQGCAGSKGAEREEVLLLDDDLVNKTVPLILCREEDVEGEHGASIGKLSEEVLFYLRTRGLSDEEIYSLMASGRLMSTVSVIGDEVTERKLAKLILNDTEYEDETVS